MWVFFRTHCFYLQETYAITGDEVVTTKVGHKTYGVDWLFSSLAEPPIQGLAFVTPPRQAVDLDSLRFQIEFNFRDAKQFWGLKAFYRAIGYVIEVIK